MSTKSELLARCMELEQEINGKDQIIINLQKDIDGIILKRIASENPSIDWMSEYLVHAIEIYRLLPNDLSKWPEVIDGKLKEVPEEMREGVRIYLREMYQRIQIANKAKKKLGVENGIHTSKRR